jgi:multiple sugar transport system substrate-binding protein
MRGSRSRIAVIAAAAVMASGALAACGGDGGDEGGSRTLQMWTFLDPASADDPRGKALKAVVDDFNAKNAPLKVEVRSINFARIDAEVIRATASNSGPDIVNVYTAQLPAHVGAGTTLPLDKYAKPLLDRLGDDYFFPRDAATFDGKLMALPWETRAWLLWYREDMLKQAGLQPPTTLEELKTTAAALRRASGDKQTGLAIGFSAAGLGADFVEKFVPLTWGYGGEVLNQSGSPAFNSDAGVKALNYMRDLRSAGAFGDEVLNMGADDVVNGVKAGSVAMAIEGSFRVAAARSGQGVGNNLRTMPPPSDVAGKPLPTQVAGQTLAIGASTKAPEDAWRFIEHYLSAESQAKFAAAGVLPVLKSVYDRPEVTGLPNAAEIKEWRDYVTQSGRPAPRSPRFNEISDALVKGGQQAVFKNAPADTTLNDIATNFK